MLIDTIYYVFIGCGLAGLALVWYLARLVAAKPVSDEKAREIASAINLAL